MLLTGTAAAFPWAAPACMLHALCLACWPALRLLHTATKIPFPGPAWREEERLLFLLMTWGIPSFICTPTCHPSSLHLSLQLRHCTCRPACRPGTACGPLYFSPSSTRACHFSVSDNLPCCLPGCVLLLPWRVHPSMSLSQQNICLASLSVSFSLCLFYSLLCFYH